MDKKNVLVIGANGKIGTLLVKKLQDTEKLIPIAGIRNLEQAKKFDKLDIQHIMFDLTNSVEELTAKMIDVHAVVFSAGSGGHTGYDQTLIIDLDGAIKSIEASEKAGVKRYIMVSGIDADNRKNWESRGIKPYYIAKHYADRFLKSSQLNYTILRPGLLLDGEGTGSIAFEVGNNKPQIFRDDVASTIVECLANDNTMGQSLVLVNGDQEITSSLQQL